MRKINRAVKIRIYPNAEQRVQNDGSRVVGLNSENPELHEGMIRFDIIFYSMSE